MPLWLLPAFCPLVTSYSRIPPQEMLPRKGSCFLKSDVPLEAVWIQRLGQCSNTGQFWGASPSKKSLYVSIDLLKCHPGLTPNTAQSCLHSLMGLFQKSKNTQYASLSPLETPPKTRSCCYFFPFRDRVFKSQTMWWAVEKQYICKNIR